MRGQLTARGIVIGCIGCIVITAASAYTALKMGALPWPIVFAALVALFFLHVFGSRSLNEANVTHTIMSAGAMVAGGLAFTIPGIWMLGLGEVSFAQMLLIAIAGVILGLFACSYLRRQFVEEQELEFPIGQAAAETLKACDAGGKVGAKLFSAMGLAGLWAALRDVAGVIPALVLGEVAIPGIAFGVSMSPMFLAVGFLVGTTAMVVWMGGALLQMALVTGGSAVGLWSVELGQAINSSLGMGLMMGGGIGVVLKDVLPKGIKALSACSARVDAAGAGKANATAGACALIGAAIALVICLLLGIGSVAGVIVVLLSFVTVAMSAQSVGQTGIDPMEIFGLIVLLAVAAVGDTPEMQLFFVAAVVAVACGLGGDVMNDFKAGRMLGTNPKAQIAGQAIGGILGALVAAGAMFALVSAYGPEAFGPSNEFVAAQASVVATLVSGIPHLPAFIVGLALGALIYFMGGPSMMIGMGVYLPFYMTFTAFLGCVVKWVYDVIMKSRRASLPVDQQAAAKERADQDGLVVASGVLGGESIVGVIIALVAVFM